MTRTLLQSAAILAMAFFAGQSCRLLAQAAPVERGMQREFGLRRVLGPPLDSVGAAHETAPAASDQDAPFLPATLPAVPRQTTGSQPDAVALGSAPKKVYKFRSIDYPGSDFSEATDFDDGTVVGSMGSQGFYFRGNSYHALQFSFAQFTVLNGINASGQMVGNYTDQSRVEHGFLYDGTNFTTIDPSGSTGAEANDINDAGHIVGDYLDAENVLHGFLYNGRQFTNVDFPGAIGTLAYGINTKGEIVGIYYDSAGAHGFLLNKKVYSSIDYPGASSTYGYGINDAGATAGEFQDAGGLVHGFTHSGSAFNQVDVPGARLTTLYRIKNDGSVVGAVIDTLKEPHGVIGH